MGEVLTTISKIMCPHGGQAILTTSNTKVSTNNSFWLLENDIHTIAGCPFVRGDTYSPCVRIKWSSGSIRTTINGIPVLKRESVGICYNSENVPQGTAIILNTQLRVKTQ